MARKLKKQYALAPTISSITENDLYPTLADALAHPAEFKRHGGLYASRFESVVAANPTAYNTKWCVIWDGKNLSTATFTKIGS